MCRSLTSLCCSFLADRDTDLLNQNMLADQECSLLLLLLLALRFPVVDVRGGNLDNTCTMHSVV